MASRASSPRIPPRQREECDDKAQSLWDSAAGGSRVNIFSTLLWDPDVLEVYGPFGSKLRRGIIPPRDLELVIVRIAWRCHAATEWAGHAGPAKDAGLTDDDLARITAGP